MKSKFIIANWKENPDSLDIATKLLKITSEFHSKESSPHFIITHALPNIFAGLLITENPKEKIILQNISKHMSGSHTGEISATQAKKLGIQMSIVGHSETRLSPENNHGDEDKDVNQKVKNLLSEQMLVCLCIGEYSRDDADWRSFLEQQTKDCLADITNVDLEKIIFAYEPVWAIGEKAKRPATTEEIIETISFIKDKIKGSYPEIENVKVLYGGSVDDKNAKEILDLEVVDGLLIGRASSDPLKWEKLLDTLQTNKKNIMNKIENLNIKEGEKVLLRVDFNVPTDQNGNITNFFRINETLPTILELQKMEAKIIIIAHKEEGSLEKVAEYLKTKIAYFSFDKEAQKQVHLLENIRLDKREKSKDVTVRDELGKELSLMGDYYINEAFSASHRDHASITSIPKFFTSEKKCLGPKFLVEIEKLSLALSPKHPMLLLVGGAKFDTKLALLEKFLDTADKIFVGGALAHTFWKNKSYNLGQSLIDQEVVLSEKVINAEISGKIFLPSDVMVENRESKKPNELNTDERVVDFGKVTLENILSIAKNSNTIVWNGPVDFYEKGFDWGTKELLENLERLIVENREKQIILGGGDTVTEIEKVRDEKRKSDPDFNFHFTHVSTGGGAMIDFLSNGTLPGIESIK